MNNVQVIDSQVISNKVASTVIKGFGYDKNTKRNEKIFDNVKVFDEKSLKESINQNESNFIIQQEKIKNFNEELFNEIKKINSQLDIIDKEVKISVNEEIERVILTVINKRTSEILYEYPYKEIQNLIADLKEMTGFLYDKKV